MQAKNMSMSPEFSGFLDFVRWMAALLVVLQHIRYLWFAEYADIQNKTILFKLFYFLTGFGSEAVMVFFVLSGFLVGGGGLRKYRDGKYSVSDYFINRFSRIYTVLLPALIFGGLLDWIGLQYFNGTAIYTNSPLHPTRLLNFNISNQLDWPTFLANLVNLEGILTSHFGSNGPLWSLAYEWWYYCLFALILELFRKKFTDLLFWIFVTGILGAIIVLPIGLLLYMLIWGIGVLAAIINPERIKFSPYIGCAMFILILIGSRLFHILLDKSDLPGMFIIGFFVNLLLAISFSLLIISLRKQSFPNFQHLAFHKLMADFSYTVYLMHVPLLVFITAILSSNFGVPFFVQPTLQVFLISALLLLLIYVALYLYSRNTERFTPNIKACLTSLITIKKTP